MGLDKAQLLDAYARMKTIREFEERIHRENTTGDIPGFVHLYAGQEAIAAGVCIHLRDQDYIGSTHRGHGHSIAKGCDVHGMMAEIFGKKDGLCGGKGGSMHIADLELGMLGANAIVGGNPPLAVGAALSAKVQKNAGVAVSFSGDGASNQGTTFEAMNMAVVLQLPVVFVFENNGYGEATGCSYAVGGSSIAERAAGFGLPAVTVDGTDFFAVEKAASEAITRAREGQGPSVIEAKAMRFYGHFEGDPQAYRSREELQRIRESGDCLKKFNAMAQAQAAITKEEFERIDADILQLIDSAVEQARAAEFPQVNDLLTDVYVAYQ
ncbi:MAG: thiamine pyrophosphate-dependent dehydrogenase E1 component subunit alpha [Pseudomonadales bacterium]|nr:thiamine pyrophosphate-dependent dehydrogenase E1 component subunit alpha [Pseudomonadales bacterium]MCP5215020.1 thiamine pyrophosphate-dependent dehydrogenase E1 component subunit alpha [Pseudomonadales bacterium]